MRRRHVLKSIGTVAATATVGTALTGKAAAEVSESEFTYITIKGQGPRQQYTIHAHDTIRPNPAASSHLNSRDIIDGDTATGSVTVGEDPYIALGGVESVEGDVEYEIGDVGLTNELVTVIGNGPRSKYFIEANGGVIAPLNGTLNRGDNFNDDYTRVDGNVTIGEDQYIILGGEIGTGSQVFGEAEFEFPPN